MRCAARVDPAHRRFAAGRRAGEGFAADTFENASHRRTRASLTLRLLHVIPPRERRRGDHAKRGGAGLGPTDAGRGASRLRPRGGRCGRTGRPSSSVLLRRRPASPTTRSGGLAARGSEPRTRATLHSTLRPRHTTRTPRAMTILVPQETLSLESHGRVAVVTFRRGRAAQRDQHAHAGRDHRGVRGARQRRQQSTSIVVTGEGRGFMAGADIKEYAAQSEAGFDDFQSRGKRMYAAIEDNRKPVIAAVNGYALGGGLRACPLLRHRHRREHRQDGPARDQARLVPGGGGTQRSVAKLGRNRANYLLMTGAHPPGRRFRALGPGQRDRRSGRADAARPGARGGNRRRAAGCRPRPEDADPPRHRRRRRSRPRREGDLVRQLFRSDIAKTRVRDFAEKSAARTRK